MEEKTLQEKEIKDFSQDNHDIRTTVVRKMWSYINENFHKFTDNNKVKVALALAQKDMPTQLDGKVSETIINIIKANVPEVKQAEPTQEGRRLTIDA